MHRRLACFKCSTRYLMLVNTARSSSTLMCSAEPAHAQEATVFHRHRRAGMLLRSLWNFTGTSVAAWSRMSSPLSDTKEHNLRTSSGLQGELLVLPLMGGRASKVCRFLPFPGVNRSTTSWGRSWAMIPLSANSELSSQAMTGTHQLFPSRVRRQSVWWLVPWSRFGRHWEV